MQIVIDGAHRGELDRRVRQPVQNVALAIFRGDRVEVVDARIPAETLDGEAVAQAAKRLVLLQQKHLVPDLRQRGGGRHAAHAGADDDGVPVGFVSVAHGGIPFLVGWPVARESAALAAKSCDAMTSPGRRCLSPRTFAFRLPTETSGHLDVRQGGPVGCAI